MLNIHDEARSRKMFSINMAWKEMMDRRRMVGDIREMTDNVLLLTVIAHNNIELHLVYVE